MHMKMIELKNLFYYVRKGLVVCSVIVLLLTGSLTPLHAEEEDENAGGPPAVTNASNPYYGGWSNCTWGAWQLVYEYTGIALPAWHNAWQWYQDAMADGFEVSQYPRANSIGVWNSHVVYVTEFDGQNIYVKEGGFLGGYNEGWSDGFSSRYGEPLIGYIYIPGEMSEISAPTSASTQLTAVERIEETPSVEMAIAPEVREQLIENLDEDVVKRYNDTFKEKIKTDEAQAIEDVKKEDSEQVKKITTSEKILNPSSKTTKSIITTMISPLQSNNE